jgi:FkbM family methyltransferase
MIYNYKKYKFNIPDESVNAKSDKKHKSIGQRMESGEWENDEIQILSSYLDEKDKVVELGACIGFLGVLVNDKLSNKSDHVVIEANPDLIPIIEENKKVNNSEFKVEHCLIGNSNNKFLDFNVSDFILGSSIHGKGGRVVKVPIKPLSAYSNKYNFLIVDIEGGEYELIRKYQNEISKFKKILIEFHPFFGFSEKDIEISLNTLRSLGFKVAERKAHVYMMIKNKSNDSNNSY